MTIKLYSQSVFTAFFALNHEFYQPLEPKGLLHAVILKHSAAQPHLRMLCGEGWQSAEQVLPNSSFLPSSQRIWEQLVSQAKFRRQHKAYPDKKVQPLVLVAHPFPPPWKAAVGAPCTVHYSRVPLLPTSAALGMEKPLTQSLPGPPVVPLQRDTAVQRHLCLHDSVLWARAHLLYLLVLHCFTPFLLDLLKTEPPHNIRNKFALRPFLHDFAGDSINSKGRPYLLS